MEEQLRNLKMEKDEVVAYFFTNISEVRDQLTSIGVVVDKVELIQTIMVSHPHGRHF